VTCIRIANVHYLLEKDSTECKHYSSETSTHTLFSSHFQVSWVSLSFPLVFPPSPFMHSPVQVKANSHIFTGQSHQGESPLSLSLQSTSHRHSHLHVLSPCRIVNLSKACRLAVARPKLSRRRSSSTVLNCRFASVYWFYITSLWKDPTSRSEELENK